MLILPHIWTVPDIRELQEQDTGPVYIPAACFKQSCSFVTAAPGARLSYSQLLYANKQEVWMMILKLIGIFLYQIFTIVLINDKKRLGALFPLFYTLTLCTTFRILFTFLITTFVVLLFHDANSPNLLTQSSLYIDYFGAYFSLIIIFLISLNRCFTFVSKSLNSLMFKKSSVIYLIMISFLISMFATLTSIGSSKIERIYIDRVGFFDFRKKWGYEKFICHLFYMFPIGVIFCYIFIYMKLRRNAMSSKIVKERRHDAHAAVVSVVIIYGIISLISELLQETDAFKTSSFVSILNSIPELVLPVMLFWKRAKTRKRVDIFVVGQCKPATPEDSFVHF